MFRFVLWLVPTVEKSPRSQKFLLGDLFRVPPQATCFLLHCDRTRAVRRGDRGLSSPETAANRLT